MVLLNEVFGWLVFIHILTVQMEVKEKRKRWMKGRESEQSKRGSEAVQSTKKKAVSRHKQRWGWGGGDSGCRERGTPSNSRSEEQKTRPLFWRKDDAVVVRGEREQVMW